MFAMLMKHKLFHGGNFSRLQEKVFKYYPDAEYNLKCYKDAFGDIFGKIAYFSDFSGFDYHGLLDGLSGCIGHNNNHLLFGAALKSMLNPNPTERASATHVMELMGTIAPPPRKVAVTDPNNQRSSEPLVEKDPNPCKCLSQLLKHLLPI